jgi:hypothetical protein
VCGSIAHLVVAGSCHRPEPTSWVPEGAETRSQAFHLQQWPMTGSLEGWDRPMRLSGWELEELQRRLPAAKPFVAYALSDD